jgi:hypothetical protein
VKEKLSSPSQEPFDSWACGTKKLLASAKLAAVQHTVLTKKVQNQ